MANYHLEVGVISRRKGQSIVNSVSYICGKVLNDSYNGKTYYNPRRDVLQFKIFLPNCAPPQLNQLQGLCDAVNKVERREDARTARVFIGSLPNELALNEQSKIVERFVNNNFVSIGLCAITAIHEGKNENEPRRNNPHVHIIVPTRTVESNGFYEKKNREWNKRKYINIWREDWANEQNIAYERNGLNIRVSHESLAVQGKDQEPTIHLSRIDWKKEQLGERTIVGDMKRAIKKRNDERVYQKRLEKENNLEVELFI